MHKTIKALLIVGSVVLIAATTASAQSNTGNTLLQVGVAAEAAIVVNTATTNLTATGTVFNDYTGATSFTYKVRTTKVGGSGTVTASIATDFSGTGPKIASSVLTYTSATTGVGTGNTTAVTALIGTATNILTFGTNAHSTKPGDSGAVSWKLANDPTYETGTYSTTVVLTISAT